MNTNVCKSAAICLHAGILILFLLLIPSGRAFAQTYSWMDYGNCFWSPIPWGPYTSPTDAFNTCTSQYSKDGGVLFQFEMHGAYTGNSESDPPCQTPPTALGQQCWVDIWYYFLPSQPNWTQYGMYPLYSAVSPQYFIAALPTLQSEMRSNNHAGNDPINPATGNVYTVETDVTFKGAGAVSYTRYYSSNDTTGVDGVPGWRHSYARSIATVYSNPPLIYSPAQSPAVSQLYTTPAAACISGFSTIQSSVPGWSGATASYSNGVCAVTVGGVVVAYLPIYTAGLPPPPPPQPIEYDVVRDDGQVLRYPIQGGSVVNPPGVSIRFAVNGSGFTVTDDDDNVESYNASGVLQSITSRSGVVQTLSYSGGLFSGVTDSFGNSISVTRNAQNNIGSISVRGGGTVQYAYNSSQQLWQVTNLDSTTRTYAYALGYASALNQITDENGIAYLTWNYDSRGRGLNVQFVGSVGSVSLTYNSGGTVTATDALGAARTFSYTRYGDIDKVTAISGSQCPTCQESASTTYDSYGWVASRTEYNGNLTCYANDPVRGLELVRVEGFAPGSTCPSNLSSYTPQSGTLQRKITTAWDTKWREPDSITEPNRITTFAYDSYGNVLTKTVTDTSVTPNVARTWTYAYYSSGLYGQIHTLTGPRTDITTDVTTYTYYNCATGGKCGQIDTITNGLSQVTTFTGYNVYGEPLTITDPNSVLTTLQYDARERLTSRQVGTETTSYTYWPIGLLKQVTLPDSSTILLTYDPAHRLTTVTDGVGNYISYTLDAMGNHTAENWYDPTGVLHRTHTRVYNTLNELYQDINAAGTSAVTTTLGYDSQGNLTSSDAPLSRNTENQYDALNRLSQITDPNSGITILGYDANGNLASVKDPRSLTTSYTHNGFNDVTQFVSPDTGTTVNTYDSAGNLKTATDARSDLATYSYDALNRLTQAAYADQTITFTYDSVANGNYGKGRLTGASDANHTLAWNYDSHGRVIGKGQTIGTKTLAVGYGYTNDDLASVVTPSGQTIAYSYTNHRITSITVNGTVLLNNVTYDPFGPVDGWTWGNATTVSRTYDQDGRVTAISTAGDPIDFAYDYASRITSITDTGTGADTWTPIGYDLLDRLTSAAKTGTTYGWTYDANGNRKTQTGTSASTFTPATTSNLLSSTTGALVRTYGYDAAGNTKSYSNLGFTYNDRGRMSSATVGSTTTDYIYSAVGQMIKKTVGSTVTVLVYDEAGHVLGEYTSAGVLIQETIWMGDIPVATLRPNGSTACTTTICIFYVHTDQLNAPRKISQPSTGTLAWRWDTDPFGTATPNQNPGGLGAFKYNLRFPGQYYQAETGLNQNYFRDYDPQTGRYVESDPIGLRGGVNTYDYVIENPLSFRDPQGKELIGAIWGGAFGAASGFLGAIASSGCKPINWWKVGAATLVGAGTGAAIGAFAPALLLTGGAGAFIDTAVASVGIRTASSIGGNLVGQGVSAITDPADFQFNVGSTIGSGVAGAFGGTVGVVGSAARAEGILSNGAFGRFATGFPGVLAAVGISAENAPSGCACK
jgi:RHS repeat-associated protein